VSLLLPHTFQSGCAPGGYDMVPFQIVQCPANILMDLVVSHTELLILALKAKPNSDQKTQETFSNLCNDQ